MPAVLVLLLPHSPTAANNSFLCVHISLFAPALKTSCRNVMYRASSATCGLQCTGLTSHVSAGERCTGRSWNCYYMVAPDGQQSCQ